MNPTLSKICRLLKDERQEVRQAAAIILGEIGTQERAVTKSICDALSSGDDLLKVRLLLSMANVPSAAYLPNLILLLNQGGVVRERAREAIVAIGPRVFPLLKKRYRDGSEAEKRSIISIFSELANKDSIVFLIDCLPDSNFEFLKYICFTLKSRLNAYDKQTKSLLRRKVLSLMTDNFLKRNPNAFISCLIILGMLRDPQSKDKLLIYARTKFNIRIRKYALGALSQLQYNDKGNNAVICELLPYLKETDFQSVVKPTLDVLSRFQIPKQLSTQIEALVGSSHISVREFALSRMGELGSRKSVRMLLDQFTSGDLKLREAARVSLERMPVAIPMILERIEKANSLDEAHRLITLLRGHRSYFKGPQARKLFLKYEKVAEKGDERAQIYLTLLSLVNPDILYQQTMAKVGALKRKKRFAQARKFLASLQGSPLFNQEARVEMALLELKLSRKDLNLHGRDNDPAIRLLTGLVRGSESFVLARIKKDKTINVEDLYYVGFHFSEKLFELRDFGIQVLKMLSRKYPRSKYSSLAKKKASIVASATPNNIVAGRRT